MAPQPGALNSRWVIVAIPAAVILLPLSIILIATALKPDKKPDEDAVVSVQPAATPTPSPVAEPTSAEEPKSPPQAQAVDSPPPEPAAPIVSPAPAATPAPPPPSPTPQAVAAAPAIPAPTAVAVAVPEPAPLPPLPKVPIPSVPAIDLIAALDVEGSSVSGDWLKDGAVIRCANATAKNRAKLRLVPPPPGGGYDLSVTFTASGNRRFVAPILSFHGKQFIFAMYDDLSGFASVRGQNARANETTKSKGVTAGAKHTSLIKVREGEVTAYLDGELLSSHKTDYSDLDLSQAWNLGASDSRQELIGIAAECPVTIETITLTPLEPLPPASAPTPALPSYKDLAAIVSSPFSRESSAAATQPANAKRFDRKTAEAIVAAKQPVISDVAAELLRQMDAPASAGADAGAREALFRAVQIAVSPATQALDPLLETAASSDSWPTSVDRAEFNAEQARLAAWRTLVARMGEFYPNAKAQAGIVKLRLAADDGSAKGPPRSFFATHSHSEPLANVTLAVEIVHSLTSPSLTAVHYYHIARWPAGQKIYFPISFVPNVTSRELLEAAGPSALPGPSGLVEARVQLWSDKVTQPSQPISFDANFAAIAREDLDEAFRLVDDALRRPAGATRPVATPQAKRTTALVAGPIVPARSDLSDDAPELLRARALAKRAGGLLAPQSAHAEAAKQLASQPQAALRELRKRQIGAYVDALTARSTRAGVWVVHKPGTLAKLAKPNDREGVVSAAGAAGGRVTLTIDSRATDGTSVAVTLTSQNQPDLKRKFAGRLQVDSSNANRLLLNLRATQPPPSKPPAEADLAKVVHWTSILLEQRGNSLIGIATAGPTEATTVLDIAFNAAKNPPAPQSPGTPRK